tara:strand:- start:8187 stop:9518 length:1332 start_codon:yes stop_codon:yes gene_type:complete
MKLIITYNKLIIIKNMKLDVRNINGFTKQLKIFVKWENLKASYETEFNNFKSNYTPPGGRKGKVFGQSLTLLKKKYTPSIEAKFLDTSINTYYKKALIELRLTPINQGQVTKAIFKEMTDLELEINFEVKPDFKLPNFKKKVTIKTEKYIAGDKDVNDALLDLQTKHAKTQSIKGPIKSGNFIYGDFNKLDNRGAPIEGSVLKNHFVKIGEGLFSGKIGEKFIGKKNGDEVKVKIEQDKHPINYLVKINNIEEQILPKIDDEFLKLVDPKIKDLKELKTNLLNKIQNDLDIENKKQYHNKIVDYFVDKTKLEAPQSMIDNYKNHLIEEYKKQYKQMNQEFDETKVSDTLNKNSENSVKWILIRDILFKDEKINISDKDTNNFIEDQLKKNLNYKKEIKKYYLENDNKQKLKEDLLNQKLYSNLENYFINKIDENSTDKLKKKK